jgi:hypothetical protein
VVAGGVEDEVGGGASVELHVALSKVARSSISTDRGKLFGSHITSANEGK